MITRDEVIAALDRVLDPELHRSIVALGMVGTVEVDGSRVAITIKLTVAGCPLKAEIQRRVSEAVAVLPGVEGVQVGLDTMTDEERAGVRDNIIGGPRKDSPFGADSPTKVILVASGKGGVGKSSVTCNLAVAMAEAGYSVPRMMGADRQPVMMDDLIIPVESHGVRLMSIGFMTADDNPVIWRGPMLHKALTSFVTEVFWDDPDVLLVDLPPGTGDVSLSLAGLLPAAHVVVVTTPQLTAQRVARRAAAMADRVALPVVGVIENRSWFIAPDTGARYEVFAGGGGAALAADIGVPLLGQVPLESDVARAGDEGLPVVAARPDSAAAKELRVIATKVAEAVGLARATG